MSRGGVWYAVWLSVHAALARVPAKMARDRADSDGFPANAAVVAAVVGGPARGAGEASGGCGRGCGGIVCCWRFSLVSLGLGWFWVGFREKPS